MAKISLKSDIEVLAGVGARKKEAYRKLGVETLGDLLSLYPRYLENRGDIRLLSTVTDGEKHAFLLTVATAPQKVTLRNHKSFLKFRAYDDSASCSVIFFNQDYLAKTIAYGATYRFYGRVENYRGTLTMTSPKMEPWTEDSALPPFIPVYPLTEGLTQNQIIKDVRNTFFLLKDELPEYFPEQFLHKNGLISYEEAIRQIHFPATERQYEDAQRRLIYEELFLYAVAVQHRINLEKKQSAYPCTDTDITEFLKQLPFSLTDGQKTAIDEILTDLTKATPMTRMLVGDVGCGKTVCAEASIYVALKNKRQAILMAPTEILARQHYAEMQPLFRTLGYESALLVGSTKQSEKKRIKEELANGTLPLVIGTHALLTDNVQLKFPCLAVTDEQHRFGAGQRAVLEEKNLYSHMLVMSATPIPRSLSLVLYGDLSLSRIEEMPVGRQRVDTFVVGESYRERLNAFIRKNVEEGGQVYIVCPSIEEDEDDEENERPALQSVLPYASDLQNALPDVSIGFLHGKMSPTEKDNMMKKFADGAVSVLVSTTVIEVGVNVPNATLMIVENAERFGLSQLHQLRGRVGRGNRKSYCVLVMGSGISQRGRERLNTMKNTYDGFEIARQDLEQRGPGDFLAIYKGGKVRQSGRIAFQLADTLRDATLMENAFNDAKVLLQSDPDLMSSPVLLERWTEKYSEMLGTTN